VNVVHVAGRVGLKTLQWLLAAAIIYVLWTYVIKDHVSKAFFAGPQATWDQLVAYAKDGTLWSMVQVTLEETIVGFTIGTAIGVVLALVIGLTPPLIGRVFEPFIAGFYTTPKFVFVPVMFVWIGSGFLPRMYLVLLATFPIIAIYMISGMRTVDPATMRALQLYGASKAQIGRKLLLPHTARYFVTAVTFALPHALTFAIGAEILFGSSTGIGGVLFSAGNFFNSAGVLAALVVGTVLSAIFIWFAGLLGRRLTGVEAQGSI
jgi:NitT/TauT family transport system permease protein